MHVRTFIYDSRTATGTARTVRGRLRDREETVDVVDVAAADGARREAMLRVGQATRVGSKPDAIFDVDGDPDFSAGVVILDRADGRRELHVGDDALDALADGE